MKLSPIEKKMLAATFACLFLLGYCLYSINSGLEEISENGGFKAVFEELWEGKSND